MPDDENAEAVQFAWDYANPKLTLGLKTLRHECAYYKEKGFKYLYIGGADEYKNKMKKAYKAGDAVKGEFYDRRQHAMKIKLNDLYGCYAINGWRYCYAF